MADPITWDSLVKAIGDLTTITEEIGTLILNHNLDPSAHGQSNEAVYNHRISELLDHVSYSIYNVKMNPAARIYKAIVGPGFEADFATIQAAIDWAHLYGGGIVHIKAGTYAQTDDITLYDNITLQGEDDDSSIISFDGVYKQIKIIGTNGTHKKNIIIRDLCIRDSYVDDAMVHLEYADDIIIQDCKFDNETGELGNQPMHLLIYNGCNRINIRRNRFLNGWGCIGFGSPNYVWIDDNYFYNNAKDCIAGTYPNSLFIRGNMFDRYTTDALYEGAIYFDSQIDNLIIENNNFYNGNNQGIYLTSTNYALITNNNIRQTTGSYSGIALDNCDKCVIVGNLVEGSDGSGIVLTDCDYCTLTGNVFTNTGAYGVDIANAGCNKTIVVANSLLGNSSGAYNDAGTSSIIQHNSS